MSASSGQHPPSDTHHVQENIPVAMTDQEITGIIGEAKKALQQMPEIDEARIAELRQAIANGSILLDVDTLAWDMLDFYRNRADKSD
ncbi:flagellar biosynthesis anti-sigma factor FlgM [Winslowiella iniecta]|nr:flagellar biosynthesis anti-sigma factor FlgM [Winslowiella iniecta]